MLRADQQAVLLLASAIHVADELRLVFDRGVVLLGGNRHEFVKQVNWGD
jgi:hypothetical protein